MKFYLNLLFFLSCATALMGEQEIVIFLGPPGSGKGTQAETLKKEASLAHISTGDLIRGFLKENPDSPLAKQMRGYTEKGELVPDQMIIEILRERLKKNDAQKGILLDGFPRTVSQAQALDGLLGNGAKILVINFDISDEQVIDRLSGRLTCSKCQTIYNQKTNPPQVANRCDMCQADLIQRKDDTLDTIKNRLVVYKKETQPLIQYYQNKGVLKTVCADKKRESIESEVKGLFDHAFTSPH